MKPGDTYSDHGTTVTVLREQESCTDRFGQPMLRYWARRADTGAEGWVTFGPEGTVTE
jgi:hypothetical protein